MLYVVHELQVPVMTLLFIFYFLASVAFLFLLFGDYVGDLLSSRKRTVDWSWRHPPKKHGKVRRGSSPTRIAASAPRRVSWLLKRRR